MLWKSSLRCLLLLLAVLGTACRDQNPAGKTPAPAETDTLTRTFVLNQSGDSAVIAGDYSHAITYFQQAMDLAAAEADSFGYYDNKLDLACVYERLSQLDQSIALGNEVLSAYQRSGDTSRIGRAYSTLASFYGKAGMQAESIAAAAQGLAILKTVGSSIALCAAYNQLAFTFSDAGQWDKALPLLDTALFHMEASGILDQLPGIQLNIGDCYRHLSQWGKADEYLIAANQGADSLGYVHIHARGMELRSLIAQAKGDYPAALRLYQTSRLLKDSVINEQKNQTIQNLLIQYQTQEKEQENQLLKSKQEVEVTRRKLLTVLVFTILFFSASAIYWWWMRLKKAQAELAENQQELRDYAQTLMNKNTQIQALEERLNQNAEQPATDWDTFDVQIFTAEDWMTFKQKFERSFPGYLLRLRNGYPQLTNAEERLFLLYKLNFNGREIAAILGISDASVKKGRTRLRKSLQIKDSGSLEQFIKAF